MRKWWGNKQKPEPIIFNTDADALLWNSLLIAVVLTAVAAIMKFGI